MSLSKTEVVLLYALNCYFQKTLAEVGKVITSEITVSPNAEEKCAQKYANALSDLRKQLDQDKRTKILRKERAKQKSILHKNTSDLTVMEKLQLQASEEAQTKLIPSRKLLGAKKVKDNKSTHKLSKNPFNKFKSK